MTLICTLGLVALRILIGLTILASLLTGCAGAYVQPCAMTLMPDGKYYVAQTPCVRTVQMSLNAKKFKAVCVDGKEPVIKTDTRELQCQAIDKKIGKEKP